MTGPTKAVAPRGWALMDDLKLALVTGATGALGPILVHRLLSEGYRVRALVERIPDAGVLPDAVEMVPGDITDRGALSQAVAGADVVFHLAAKLHIPDPAPGLKAEYERINVEGTRRLLEVAGTSQVQRFVFFSSICVYGPGRSGPMLDEQSPLDPDTYYAETKARAEEIALASGVPVMVLRLAAVYGARVKGNYERLLRALQRGRYVSIGPGTNRRTLVHEQDVAAAALVAAGRALTDKRIYNVTDGGLHDLNEIVQAMCLALGTATPWLRVPAPPVRLMAGLVEDACRGLGRKAPIGRSTVDKLLEDVAVSGARFISDFGFRPQMDLRSGWADAVQKMRGGGL